ncbi:5-hydroxyisourate hydrolase-like [Ptychodera flava]|uniref:5-hydroxyisourate hydrolase-like n=1 Tax=Ptychodera flava TaxID=63121 RepID=UPI00396A70F2
MSSDRLERIAGHIEVEGRHKLTLHPRDMAGAQSPLTTHVLDTATGKPAANLAIRLLYRRNENEWDLITNGKTNSDGRCPGLLTKEQFPVGVYKMHFDTGAYHQSQNVQGFYPYVEIVFEIRDPSQHYHVPLLLSPFGYSTYRGS